MKSENSFSHWVIQASNHSQLTLSRGAAAPVQIVPRCASFQAFKSFKGLIGGEIAIFDSSFETVPACFLFHFLAILTKSGFSYADAAIVKTFPHFGSSRNVKVSLGLSSVTRLFS
jgi:hypothetical protein